MEEQTITQTDQNTDQHDNPNECTASDSQSEHSLEENLAERERAVAEREQAIAIAEKRGIAARHLNENKLPEELTKYVNIESEESIKESVTELYNILEKYAKNYNERYIASLPTISTGIVHGKPPQLHSDTGFLKGLTG